jgi:hypothetical protein
MPKKKFSAEQIVTRLCQVEVSMEHGNSTPVACRDAGISLQNFQPYWGKPAVRNDREDRGNVGIIRSPVRASILPDHSGR